MEAPNEGRFVRRRRVYIISGSRQAKNVSDATFTDLIHEAVGIYTSKHFA